MGDAVGVYVGAALRQNMRHNHATVTPIHITHTGAYAYGAESFSMLFP